jgi:hypothetical protein
LLCQFSRAGQISAKQRESGPYLNLDRMPGACRFMDECFKRPTVSLASVDMRAARIALVGVPSGERGYAIRRVEVTRTSPGRTIEFVVFHEPTVLLIGCPRGCHLGQPPPSDPPALPLARWRETRRTGRVTTAQCHALPSD